MESACIVEYEDFDLPEAALIDGAFRDCFFLSFFGFMVSLLAFAFKVPPASARPDKERSGALSVACATELTVSVSTVMFLVVGSAPDFDFRLLKEALVETVFGRGVVSGSVERVLGLGDCVRSPLSLSLLPLALFDAARGVLVGDWTRRSSSDKMPEYFDSPLLMTPSCGNPAVVGRLASCTVSSFGAPLPALLGAFAALTARAATSFCRLSSKVETSSLEDAGVEG